MSDTSYTEEIKDSILSHASSENFAELKELQFLKGINYNREEYPKILEGLKKGGIGFISEIPVDARKEFEDLTFYSFKNQDNMCYVATVYDSDEMWQDPVVLDIIRIN